MNIFSKPHPFIFNKLSAIIPGLVAFLVIVVLAPLGFGDMEFSNRILFGCIFGLTASMVVFLSLKFLQKFCSSWLKEDEWNIGKELSLILFVIFQICLVNYLVVLVLQMSESNAWITFQYVVGYTIVISIFPVFLMVLTEQYVHQQKKLKEAERLNRKLVSQNELNTPLNSIAKKSDLNIMAENGIVELKISPFQIDYIRSDGNYAEVFYRNEEGSPLKKLIRNRLKYFLELLPQPQFLQVHKSYIVNTGSVKKVTGNARNLELILHKSNTRIPVSRSKTQNLRARFS